LTSIVAPFLVSTVCCPLCACRTPQVCDLFYGKYGQGGSWPQAGKHTELRDWLDKHGHGTDRDTCKTFCAHVGLTWIPPENDM